MPTPVAGDHRFEAPALGDLHTRGVSTDDRVHCWGWNGKGQLGDGTTGGRGRPAPARAPARFLTVGGNGFHTRAVTDDQTTYRWGENDVGQIGTGDTRPVLETVRVRVVL
ncbi:MAG: hypothetical protein GWN82_07260 [Gemmatimonadetes bacterium]|nr:hypothetical protein [Gemmatimonadota bacterium]NIU30512.1 hypothetical protein [Gemmatimonadota bacterium]NIW63577.1 hypothetical protein [Gemmatimonadota bacterium]NIX38922.1 hypothetical protein [Gemmatimonadota bacterium]